MKIPEYWTFKNSEVADNFDNHVREQLPWYDLATDAVIHFIRHYLPENGLIYDIGASTGNLLNKMDAILHSRNGTYHGIDNSQKMIDQWRTKTNYSDSSITLSEATDFDYKPFDCAVLFLVLMFVPFNKRKELLLKLFDLCSDGGIIIIVDKSEQPKGYYGTAVHRMTLNGKINQGIDPKEIIEKELSLQGIQRPIRFEYLLTGFSPKEFFRFGEFFGVLIEKGI